MVAVSLKKKKNKIKRKNKKNKNKINLTISTLEESNEISIKVNKALHELEEVADDPNLETYTRTQMWNVVSLLEKIA